MPGADPQRWLEFARLDLQAATRLAETELFAPACFHTQQAAEKCLKAFLLNQTNDVPHIHSLPELCKRCRQHDPSFQTLQQTCEQLDEFYQPVRYPDAPAGMLPQGLPTKSDADTALTAAQQVYDFVSRKLSSP